MLTRRGFLASLSAAPLAAQADSRPNILFLISDDLGWGDVGYHNAEVRTPNLDRLAGRGVRLSQYRTMPVCSPTRAALLTGRNSLRLGVNVPIPMNEALGIRETLLPQVLAAAGYQTALIGKWHLGNIADGYLPHRRGFQHFYGYVGGEIDYFTRRRGNQLDWQRNGQPVIEEGYTTDLLAAETIKMIRNRDRSKPFFHDVSFNAPHTPLQATPEMEAKYAHVTDANRRAYLAMVEAMDTAIGRVVDVLEEEGILQNTILVWVSDNGGNVRIGGASNGSLRGQKGMAFEGGLRVPGFIHWPNGLEGGWEFDGLFTVMDWFPTLCAAIGVPLPERIEWDGVDLWPYLTKGEGVERGPAILGQTGSYAVFRGDWKLVEHTMNGQTQRLLFRYREDPDEKKDLAAEASEIADELAAHLAKFPRGEADRR